MIYKCPILKTNIAVINMQETVEYLKNNLEILRGNYICVSNVHTTVMAYKDANYREIQNNAALALPDGQPLSLVSRKRGFHHAKRVPGPDLMTEMFAQPGYRHFFYGSTENTINRLREQLKKKYPDINIVGMYSPPFRSLTEEEDREIVRMINATNPDFVWVGLGAPKQEQWMFEHKNRINGLMLGVGAGFDFHAGTVKRAPKWMQNLCLEWLYRLAQDPKRLIKRYLPTNTAFIWYTCKEGYTVKKQIRSEHIKIAMIGHKRVPSREGGVERVVEELSTRMVDQGTFIDLYNRRGSHVSGKRYVETVGKDYKGARIITIPTFEVKSLNAIVYSILATMRAVMGRYDVIHYHAEGPCITLPWAHLFGIRTVATIHGLDWQRSKWGGFATSMLRFGERCAAKYADEIIVLSENVKDYFKKNYNRETVYIPNGISKPEIRDVSIIKEYWGLQKDKYILFLARIVPEKGAHYLVEAYSKIYEEHPELEMKKLVIAGGSSHSSGYYSSLKQAASNNDNIIFTDFIAGRALEELYSNAYLFVLPSDIEGMAMSLLEAMSYNNCCLVSDIPENMAVVGEAAVDFEAGNVEDLKDKLYELLTNQLEVARYKSVSAAHVLKRFNWDDVTQETLDMYRRLISGGE